MITTTSLGMVTRIALRSLALVSLFTWGFWHVCLVCAQSPVAITDSSTPTALTANNTGSSFTYVLNSDSSISILFGNIFITGGSCGPVLTGAYSGDTVSHGAIYFDESSSRLYAVIEGDTSAGGGAGTLVTYVTITNDGTCTPGPIVQVSTDSSGVVEIGVDSAQGNIYVVQGTNGISLDALYVLSIASFSTTPEPQVSLDYSATYGPIVIDATTHRVYINDFGGTENFPAGLNPSPGFFVYDPNNSPTASSNIQHVYGYVNSSGATVALSAQALLANSGDLILVNQNTSIANGSGATFQTSPFTILHTTASGFSFFSPTEAGPRGTSSSVYIEPGSNGVTVIGPEIDATLLYYSATGAADIDTTHGVIYRFAYNANSSSPSNATPVQNSGALISYNLATLADTLVTKEVLPLANIYPSPDIAPWSQLTFNAESDEVVVTTAGALGVSNSLACADVSVQQVLGGGATFATVGIPGMNFSTGYVYDTQVVYPTTTLYYVAPSASCSTATLVLSPASLPTGIAGQSYGPVNFVVTSGQVGSVTFSPSPSPISPAGLSLSSSGTLSGTPTQVGTFPITVTATDSVGDTGSETLPLTISCQVITVGPQPLPAAVEGVPYNLTFTQSGGIGTVTFAAFGPFPPGIQLNASGTGLTGTTTVTGSFPVGIQATDSNGCQSVNTIQTLTVVPPRFTMAFGSGYGPSACASSGPGFPLGVVPTATFNDVSYFQVNVQIYNSGNVPATANLTSAMLGSTQAFNVAAPGVNFFPIGLNSPGTVLPPGACVPLTFYYPTQAYTSVSIPISGLTEANIPQVLKLVGSFTASTTGIPSYSGNWGLTDREVLLNSTICCTNGGVLTGASATGND